MPVGDVTKILGIFEVYPHDIYCIHEHIPMFEYVIHMYVYIYIHRHIHTAFVCFLFHTVCDTWPELTYHTWTNRWLKNKCPHVSHVSSLLVTWFPNTPMFDMFLVNHWTTSRYPWVNRLLRAVVDAECCSVLVWCSIPEYCSIPAIGAQLL